MTEMRKFGVSSVGSALDQVMYYLAQASKSHEEEAVHKLRVSIRRLQQALRLFRKYVEDKESQRIRKQLRRILRGAAEVRNRDIGLKLLRKAQAPEELLAAVEAERKTAAEQLNTILRTSSRATGKWRSNLGVELK